MPDNTCYWGSLSTDKPLPSIVQEHLEFLSTIDTRSLLAPIREAFAAHIPDGFPAEEVAALSNRGIYRVSLVADDDTTIRPTDEEYPHIDVASIQFVIDAILKPHDVTVTGRIEASGGNGSTDLWSIAVGEDQVARGCDGAVVYQDQPGYPADSAAVDPVRALGARVLEWAAVDSSNTAAIDQFTASVYPTDDGAVADAVRALGLRLIDWASIDLADTEALERFAKAIEFSTIPEAAADIAGAFTPPSPECDECGAQAEPTYESAPGAFHDPSCSLHLSDHQGE